MAKGSLTDTATSKHSMRSSGGGKSGAGKGRGKSVHGVARPMFQSSWNKDYDNKSWKSGKKW